MMKSILFASFIAFIVSYTEAGGGERGDQYCELFWGNVTVMNVMGNYTNCTKSPGFYDLTAKDIRDVHGKENAPLVGWNGLREWLVDSWEEQIRKIPKDKRPTVSYGNMFPDGSGFEMMQVAVIEHGNPVYTESYSKRFSTAIFNANQWVYELIAKDCSAIYVMQSFYIGRPGTFSNLTEPSQLLNLEERLELPDGWAYRARVLENDLFIAGVNGTTAVLMDDLRNSYSKMDEPFDVELCNIEDVVRES